MLMNATLLHPGPPHVSENATVVAALVVGVMVVVGSVVGVTSSVVDGSVVKEFVVGSVIWSWLKISAQIERSVM